MSNVKIRVKRSLVSGETPPLLALGELAVNIPDKKIYIGNGTQNVLLTDFSVLGDSLTEAIQDLLNTTLVEGDNVNLTYGDTNNQLTISVPDQNIIDIISNTVIAGDNVAVTNVVDPFCVVNCNTAYTVVSVPDANIETVVFNYLQAGNNITITETTDGKLSISSTGLGGGETLWTNTAPTTATDIFGIPATTTDLVGENAIQILERILYPYSPAAITSFTMSGAATNYEVGATAATPTFSWTISNHTNTATLTFNYERGGVIDNSLPAGTTSPTINASTTNYNPSLSSLSSTVVGAGLNFYLSGTQVNNKYNFVNSTTRTIRWWTKMYWGRSSKDQYDPETTYANLTGGSNTLLTNNGSFTQTVSFGSSSGTYLYIYFHSNRSLSSIVLNTNNNVVTDSFIQLSNQTITNGNGVSVTYKVYVSKETLGGSDSYTVYLT